MNKSSAKPRTQAERRAESRAAVLESACRLFGEKGYAATSLEEIAADCGLTIRPIYHYFGNKKSLFAAVNAAMESRITEALTQHSRPGPAEFAANWRAFLDLCEDPAFRRIVLVDSPNILGRERWADSEVTRRARMIFAADERQPLELQYRTVLLSRMMMGAFTEVALMVAEADDVQLARRQAEQLVGQLFGGLLDLESGQMANTRDAQ